MEARILAFVIETTIICDPVGQPPRARRFQTQFKRAQDSRLRPDSILEYMAYTTLHSDSSSNDYERFSRGGPPKDPYLNALGVVDALCTDLIRLMYLRKVTLEYLGDTESPRPPELGYILWDSLTDSRPPADRSRLIDWETYEEGDWHFWGQYMMPMNVTITNLLVAIRDAIYLDIGNIAPSNIYANKTSFNDMIKVDEYGVKLNQIMFEHGNWTKLNADPISTWGWGNTSNVNITWAQAFTSTSGLTNNITLPIGLPANRTASVIDIDYLCPQYKMKSWGNLLMSVFVGTFSMYVAIYGVFARLASTLDRKRKGPQPYEYLLSQPSLPSHELRLGPTSSRNTPVTPAYHPIEFGYDRKGLMDDDNESGS
ncbi:hypothetical protein RhiJN_26726 [Ceratobasidium sp. AG-Ba]|nr:hypothetical protein RhiJN_26726 [Ceratobasidium sp. AG-Ba]